jgi:hypothetical protein
LQIRRKKKITKLQKEKKCLQSFNLQIREKEIYKVTAVQIVGVNHIWMVVWENGSLWLNLVLLPALLYVLLAADFYLFSA